VPVGIDTVSWHHAAMSIPTFARLNNDWNAEPNAPFEEVIVTGTTVSLTFVLNPWRYEAAEGEKGRLTFEQCSLWRRGATNDEGWHLGQCRYSKVAPAFGEFYELLGEDDQCFAATDWHELEPLASGKRHFLFYLKDNTFECFATDWRFDRGSALE
jgi:hypothetical protein